MVRGAARDCEVLGLVIEAIGDLWELARDADAVVITTNGYVNKKGEAVMGRGCALEAKQRHPWLPERLALALQARGNHVHRFSISPEQGMKMSLVTFPVKSMWYDRASLPLISRSKRELVELADAEKWLKVVMPRPGCGNGGLDWEDVRPLMANLDDRFIVTTYA